MWAEQLDCPQDATVQESEQSKAVLPMAAKSQPLAAARRLLEGVGSTYEYGLNLMFQHWYLAVWMKDTWFIGLPHFLCNGLMALVFAALFVAPPVAYARHVRARGLRVWPPLDLGMAFLLWGCVVALSGLQSMKNFYDSLPPLLLLMLAGGMVLAPFLAQAGRMAKVISGLSALGCFSMALLLHAFYDLPQVDAQTGRYGQMLNQWKTGAVTQWDLHKRFIVSHAASCGIVPGMPHVVVDQFTYLAFRVGYQPVYEVRTGVELLQAMRSSGVITSCRSLPPEVREVALEADDLCCVSKRALIEIRR
ncbi:MAG: hypothetical protein K2Q01_01335, partial [Rickettsiales bacterium]|nr:hypothetical protein [Rickettsiales bacterium]